MAYPTVMPAYPLQMYSGPGPATAGVDPSLPGFGDGRCGQSPRLPMQPTPYPAPLVTPMVALVLPNYMFPQMGSAPHQPFYPEQTSFPPQAAFSGPGPFSAAPAFPVQPPFGSQNPFPAQPQFQQFQAQPFPYLVPAEAPKTPAPEPREGVSRSSTPRDQASPPLFQSRCSSPLQLNLLQLEETPRSAEKQDGQAPPGGPQGTCMMEMSTVACPTKPSKEMQQVRARSSPNFTP